MKPSIRFKEAFKLALAMVITYAIALAMNWEKPFWAGFSVAFCSLATTGESIHRSLQRVVGTLLAGVAALILVALFPQDRWLFLLSMSALLALLTYWVSGNSRFQQIWFNAGFNIPIVAMLGGGLAASSFDYVVLRVQETALGAIIYSLVAILLWPRNGAAAFEDRIRKIYVAKRALFKHYLASLTGTPDEADEDKLRAQLTGQLAGLDQRLEGAVYDSHEIWETRHAWRRCIGELSALYQAMERWRLGFDELRQLDLQRIMPGLPASGAELDSRLAAINAMLAFQPPARQPGDLDLRLDQDRLDRLSHFQRAAVQLCRDRLARIDALTRALFARISEIRGYQRVTPPTRLNVPTLASGIIDRDRLAGTVRQSAALWLVLLMVIYVPAFPNPIGVVALANAFAMFLSFVPQVQASVLMVPTVLAALFASALYIFVMPHLSGFGELGTMIFAATFLIGYLFYRPRDLLPKSMGLCMLVIVIGVENEQTYTFLYPANWFIGGVLFVSALMVAWRFPLSFRPEDRFLALLGRFFRGMEFLLSTSPWDADAKDSWLSRWRWAFHLHEVTALPQRIRVWGKALPPAALGDTTRDQVQSLTTSLQALSDRLQAMVEVRPVADEPSVLARELLADMRAWRVGMKDVLGRLSTDAGSLEHGGASARLEARLDQLEARVEEALRKGDDQRVPSAVLDNMYRLLGAYRGLSEALVQVIQGTAPIDWARLREARF